MLWIVTNAIVAKGNRQQLEMNLCTRHCNEDCNTPELQQEVRAERKECLLRKWTKREDVRARVLLCECGGMER
jgi:hypothetical protein